MDFEKPIIKSDAAEGLIKRLTGLNILTSPAKQDIEIPGQSVALFIRGKIDCTIENTNILIATFEAPAVFNGLIYSSGIYKLNLCARTRVNYALFSQEEWDDILGENNDLAMMTLKELRRTLAFLKDKIGIYTEKQAYRQIKHFMEDYIEKEHQEKSLLSFIEERSPLSRSMITKIIYNLRVGGYIEMEDGILIDIKKELPKSY